MSVYRAEKIATEVRDERDQSTRSLLHEAANVTDPDARACLLEQAVLLNLSLARALAHQYRRQGVDPDDLVQVAMLGWSRPSTDTALTLRTHSQRTQCPRSAARSNGTSAIGVGWSARHAACRS